MSRIVKDIDDKTQVRSASLTDLDAFLQTSTEKNHDAPKEESTNEWINKFLDDLPHQKEVENLTHSRVNTNTINHQTKCSDDRYTKKNMESNTEDDEDLISWDDVDIKAGKKN
ncbi:hypothetical protein BDQ17DRAFT_1546682 [Cyathus striatus]|nr:hypothetical protein BDQ17DRAFT_1546682 [Cyathus striatus]